MSDQRNARDGATEMPNVLDEAAHLSPDVIAAYAEGRAPGPVREAVERHIGGCDECRRDVATVVRLRRTSTPRWAWPAASLLAAGILFVMVSRGANPGRGPSEPVVRSELSGRIAITVVGPDSVVDPGAATFAWRALGGQARYAFTLATVDGRPIFSTETADTVLALPARVTLERGRSYLWYVDAQTPGGRTASSGLQTLRTRP